MAYKCELCGKGIQYGHNVSHSKRRTRRVFKPNLHRVRILVEGQMKRMRLCTKCLRSTKVKPDKTEPQKPKLEKPQAVEKIVAWEGKEATLPPQ